MIIGITGYGNSGQKQIGKNTVSTLIQKHSLFEFKETMFAAKIKELLCMITGCTMENLEDDVFKSSFLPSCWELYSVHWMDEVSSYRSTFANKADRDVYVSELHDMDCVITKCEEAPERMTYRMALQSIGTNMFRNQFHPNTWIFATMCSIEENEDVIVTDVRFPNEAEAIKERGGMIIGISRDRVLKDLHSSETGMADYKGCDFTIENNGTLADLEVNVIELLRKAGL